MSDKPQAPRPTKVDLGKSDYSQEEVEKLLTGEVTLRDLGEISDQQLLEITETAYSMLTSGKYKEAKTLFTGLIALEPLEAYYRTALGCVLMCEENWERALEVFDEALRLNPRDPHALVNRGEVHFRLGHLEETAIDLAAAVSLDPENREPSTQRARAIASYAVQSLQQAEKEALGDSADSAASTAGPSKSLGKPKKK